jgi:hypothetical protein
MKLRPIHLFCATWLCTTLACAMFAQSSPAASPTPAGAEPSSTAAINTKASTNAASASKSIGPCANILFPLVKGNRWYYEKQTNGATSAVNLLVDSTQGDQATVNFYGAASDLTSSTKAQCQDGAILNFPASELGMLFYDPAGGSLQMEYQSGLFFPAEAVFTQAQWDYSWKTALNATGSFQVRDPESGEVFSATLEKSPVTLEWRTAGAGNKAREAVSVPAGNFPQAVKVLLTATVDALAQLDSSDGRLSLPGKIIMHATLWFEPRIGLLKEEVNTLDVEYRGFTIPQDATSVLVLKKYLQSK